MFQPDNTEWTLANQGIMMKKKTSTPSILRPITLEWTTRHFFLYENGKMIYARDGAIVDPDKMTLLCNNIAHCTIDRVTASEMGKKRSYVANSFYITVPTEEGGNDAVKRCNKKMLLVTNGPEEFKKWIAAFRRLRATVNLEEESPSGASRSVSVGDIPIEVSSKHSVEVSALNMSDVKFGYPDMDVEGAEKLESIDDEKQHVRFSVEDEVIVVPEADKPGVKREKSVSFDETSLGEVIPDVEQLSEVSGEISGDDPLPDKKVVVSFAMGAGKEVINDEHVSEKKVSFRSVRGLVQEEETNLEKKVSFRTVKEDVSNAIVIDDVPALDRKVSFSDADPEEIMDDDVLENEPPQALEDLEVSAFDEGVLFPAGCKGAKVFAYGDSLDELTEALNAEAVLYGIVTTSLEETMDDETYANTTYQQSLSKLKAFSIEFLGTKADPIKAERFEQHLSEIISFCKRSSNLQDLHPIRCGDAAKAKDEIVSVLQVIEDGNDEVEAETSIISNTGIDFEYDPSSGLTAYKYALQTQDPSDIPNASQVLECVRQQMGLPYNWVVFQPSQTELVVEDAGSGGVIEMTKVLHESYSDRVLFGLARVSFMGRESFGRRQIWFALEWNGESGTSVKMIRELRDCAAKMHEMIGDRSFLMTNMSAADLTPDAVCAWVKRSCEVNDFILSEESMNSAHIEEQKVIKTYYEKLAEKEAAVRLAKEAKRKEQLRKERLWLRQETRENAELLREERKEKWSDMTVPDILKDLGDKESLSGWVLLEVDV